MNATSVLIAIFAMAAATPEVRLRPAEGQAQTVRLTELSASQATFQAGSESKTLPVAEILWLEFPTAKVEGQPSAWIELVDGSRLVAAQFTTKDGQADIALTSGQRVTMPTRSIRAVRFTKPTAELAEAWQAILDARPAGDLVIVPRETTRQIEDGENEPTTVREVSLDQLDGTIVDVQAETVQFSVGGEVVPAKREKLAGIVYYQPTRRQYSSPRCRLIDSGGSVWALRDVGLSDGQFTATSVGGVEFTLPGSAISKLDFSVGNLRFLADLEPDSGGEPQLALEPANMTISFSRVLGLRAAPPLGAETFRIQGREYESGLSLHSPLKLVYRVPEDFRRFRVVAGIDDSLLAPGTFELVILGDGKELMRQRFGSGLPRGPVPIDLDLAGVRRITIVLEAADGQDIGDQLSLCEARFTK